MKHPYPHTKRKAGKYPPRCPLWACLTCNKLVPRADVTSHALRPGHSLVPAL